REEPAAAPVRVQAFTGLTVDFARSVGASALLRGVRNLSDLQYEVQQAVTNREVAGLETAFVVAGQTFAYTSSSLIKQITAMGKNLSALSTTVPAPRVCPPYLLLCCSADLLLFLWTSASSPSAPSPPTRSATSRAPRA